MSTQVWEILDPDSYKRTIESDRRGRTTFSEAGYNLDGVGGANAALGLQEPEEVQIDA